MKGALFFIIVMFSISARCTTIELWKGGGSRYAIVLPEEVSKNTRKGAEFLQKYIKSKSGIAFPIVSENSYRGAKGIYIGQTDLSRIVSQKNKISDRGYFIGVVNENLILTGSSERGTINAIFGFLDKYLDVQLLTTDDVFLQTETYKKITVNDEYFSPSFERVDIYNAVAYNDLYGYWNGFDHLFKNNFDSEWGLFGHTFFKLVPPSLYLKSNPDFFLSKDGRPSQLNIRNKRLIQEVVKNLRNLMEKKPDKKFWMVGQEDDGKFLGGSTKNGNVSDELITFINSIAKEFPDKIIGTFAYQQTLDAPLKSKPLSNVLICFAPIDAVYHINMFTGSNRRFSEELEKWCEISNNLMVWEYVSNYSNLMLPYPTLSIVAENLKYYHRLGINRIYLEGINRSEEAFNELYTYLFLKLSRDVHLDPRSVIEEFCRKFYGDAWSDVLVYLDMLTHSVSTNGDRLRFYDTSVRFLSIENLLKYDKVLGSAANKVKNNAKFLFRVNKLRAQVDFQLLKGKVTGSDIRSIRFKNTMKAFGVRDIKGIGKFVGH